MCEIVENVSLAWDDTKSSSGIGILDSNFSRGNPTGMGISKILFRNWNAKCYIEIGKNRRRAVFVKFQHESQSFQPSTRPWRPPRSPIFYCSQIALIIYPYITICRFYVFIIFNFTFTLNCFVCYSFYRSYSTDYIFTLLWNLLHHHKALKSLIFADVPLRNYSLTHSQGRSSVVKAVGARCNQGQRWLLWITQKWVTAIVRPWQTQEKS